jgi:hypothetical protein
MVLRLTPAMNDQNIGKKVKNFSAASRHGTLEEMTLKARSMAEFTLIVIVGQPFFH